MKVCRLVQINHQLHLLPISQPVCPNCCSSKVQLYIRTHQFGFILCHRFSPIECGSFVVLEDPKNNSPSLKLLCPEGQSNALLIMANAMEFSGQCLSMMGGFVAWTFYTFTVPLRCWGERRATALALKTALEVASTQQVACARPQQRDRQRKLLQRCGYDMARILEDGHEDARMRKQRHAVLQLGGGGAFSLDWGLMGTFRRSGA